MYKIAFETVKKVGIVFLTLLGAVIVTWMFMATMDDEPHKARTLHEGEWIILK